MEQNTLISFSIEGAVDEGVFDSDDRIYDKINDKVFKNESESEDKGQKFCKANAYKFACLVFNKKS